MHQPQGYLCSLHPEPPSHLPPYAIPLGCPRAPALGTPLCASNLPWSSILHMVIYVFKDSLSNHPNPCPEVRDLRISSVQFSRSVVSDSLRPHESQHARPPCPSPSPRVHSNSRPSSRRCHPAISSSVVPFSSCLQSLPASGVLMFYFCHCGTGMLNFPSPQVLVFSCSVMSESWEPRGLPPTRLPCPSLPL